MDGLVIDATAVRVDDDGDRGPLEDCDKGEGLSYQLLRELQL